MFIVMGAIETVVDGEELRQGGHVELGYARKQQHIALLAEGDRSSASYKHCPPDGGRFINFCGWRSAQSTSEISYTGH